MKGLVRDILSSQEVSTAQEGGTASVIGLPLAGACSKAREGRGGCRDGSVAKVLPLLA